MEYNPVLVIASVAIAVVAGTAAPWAGTRVRGIGATIGASLNMGVAVSGMHYTGMAAMSVDPGSMMMSATSGSAAFNFVVPLVIGLTVVTFAIALAVSVARTSAKIAEDAMLQRRIDELEASWAMAAEPRYRRHAGDA
jgi:NO-binding membrane sensor protein with MHYT domain